MAKLKVTFPPLNKVGEVKFEVEGISGSSCQQFSSDYEKKLGAVVEVTPTSEMYESQLNQSSQEATHG